MLIFVLALHLMLAPQLIEPDPRSLKTEVSEVEFLQIWLLDDCPELLAIAFECLVLLVFEPDVWIKCLQYLLQINRMQRCPQELTLCIHVYEWTCSDCLTLFGNVLCPALWLFVPWIYDEPSWSVCVTDECQHHALPPNTCSNACLFAFSGFDC
jgi:hypothetical protein